MRSGQDDEAFDSVMKDLCLAFNRQHTPELTRVFWEALKHSHIHDVRRVALKYRNTAKKFPAPSDLTPHRTTAPQQEERRDPGPPMSSWAIAANKILFVVAYQGNRGFEPMGELLKPCLKIKADYVRMAEESTANGEPWVEHEFNVMCREGFEKLLGGSNARAQDTNASG
jgi:hypothetical protein